MIRRLYAEEAIASRLRTFPVVALLGPRQVGKTTLALAVTRDLGRGTVYLDLERDSDRAKLDEAELYLEAHRDELVIIDEVQRRAEIFSLLRSLVDERIRSGKKAGHFLVLGSASRDLLRQSSESLAGRIAYLELAPFSIAELIEAQGDIDLDRIWLRGGFPPSYLADDDSASWVWRSNFITTYLERDIPQLGPRLPAEQMRRFWTMLALEALRLRLRSAPSSGQRARPRDPSRPSRLWRFVGRFRHREPAAQNARFVAGLLLPNECAGGDRPRPRGTTARGRGRGETHGGTKGGEGISPRLRRDPRRGPLLCRAARRATPDRPRRRGHRPGRLGRLAERRMAGASDPALMADGRADPGGDWSYAPLAAPPNAPPGAGCRARRRARERQRPRARRTLRVRSQAKIPLRLLFGAALGLDN